jgi:anti-sigma B factor antagonist
MDGQPGCEPAAEQLMAISSRDLGGCAVLAVRGEVDLATEGRLVDAATAAIHLATHPPVVLDLTGVTFLSSSGLGQLAKLNAQAHRVGTPLRIVVGDNRALLHPITAMGLDTVLALYPTLEAAIST